MPADINRPHADRSGLIVFTIFREDYPCHAAFAAASS